MARITYNPATTTVSFNDVAALSVGQASIVTADATTLHVRTTVSGVLTGTLDVIFTGQFTLVGGFPAGGAFTGLRVDFNNQTLITITDFSLPLSASQAPDLDGIMAQILGGPDILTGASLGDILKGLAGADQIDGGGGLDIINGNMGNDTVAGGDGADVVRGGRDDDVVQGGAGDDFISGDRGSDTVTGGLGADTFHTFEGSGLDRVTDFSGADGDRILVFTGETYTVSQTGADTLIDLGGGDQMLLVGVQASSFQTSWILTI